MLRIIGKTDRMVFFVPRQFLWLTPTNAMYLDGKPLKNLNKLNE